MCVIKKNINLINIIIKYSPLCHKLFFHHKTTKYEENSLHHLIYFVYLHVGGTDLTSLKTMHER